MLVRNVFTLPSTSAVTVLAVGTSPVGGRRGLALRVGPEGGRLEATGRSDLPALFRPDRLTVAEAEAAGPVERLGSDVYQLLVCSCGARVVGDRISG